MSDTAAQGLPIEQGHAEQASTFKEFSQGQVAADDGKGPPIDPNPVPIAEREPDPVDAKAKLAAVEEKLLGPGVERHDGKPEKGIGSRHHALHPAHKAHFAAIEHLIEVEAEHAAAEAHLASVHARVEHAKKRVDATEEVSNAVAEEA